MLVLVSLRRPGWSAGPWGLAVGLGLLVSLGAAAEIRRVKQPEIVPLSLPGIAPTTPILLLEIPGLSPTDFDETVARGLSPGLERLSREGRRISLVAGPLADGIALHASLMTGQSVAEHGLFGAVRYRALGDRRSFAVLPRGLFLRPLLETVLWGRIPVGHEALRAPALPQIAEGLALPSAFIGDPLHWEARPPSQLRIAAESLQPGARVDVGDGGAPLSCADPGDVASWLFDTRIEVEENVPRLARLSREALSRDLCALELGRRVLATGRFPIVAVRLGGHYDIAYEFAGYREGRRARGVSEAESAAFGRVLMRYHRELAPGISALLEASPEPRLVALVSPHGIKSRHELRRLAGALWGRSMPTGTQPGPPRGLLLLAGPPIREGGRVPGVLRLERVLSTLFAAAGLPVAEDMAEPEFELVPGVPEPPRLRSFAANEAQDRMWPPRGGR